MSEAHTINVAIVGASGFSGEELIHRLLLHPHAKLVAVTSRKFAGQTLAQIFPRFAGDPVANTLQFTEPNIGSLTEAAEVVFLALPHGVAAEFAKSLVDAKVKVIDLSADF
ncbi:MAG: N-acetyl-gamma-glutamyl-phosphate reductase, partial [Pedosphaera sp.]|nr:N-acetyl-gamma-glutamyl-phosphate reductase [Pedosphaera sp.]